MVEHTGGNPATEPRAFRPAAEPPLAGPTVGHRAVARSRRIVSAPVAAKLLGLGATMVLARLLAPAARAALCGAAAWLVARVLDGLAPPLVLAPALAAAGLAYVTTLFVTDREGLFEAAGVLARGSGVTSHGR